MNNEKDQREKEARDIRKKQDPLRTEEDKKRDISDGAIPVGDPSFEEEEVLGCSY